jgi:hypothetical protein
MAGVIKKIRISRENLPPTLVVDQSVTSSLAITGVISTLNSGIPVYEYTTQTAHNFEPGNFISVVGIIDSVGQTDDQGNPLSIFNFVNVPVLTTLPTTTFQIRADETTSTSYLSGGLVAKNSGLYVVRYRIVSEDRNRASHWSPQYVLAPGSIVDDPGERIVQNQISGQSISVVWELPKNAKNQEKPELGEFDVYVAWGSTIAGVGAYEYYATVTGNSASVVIPLDSGGNRIYQSYKIAVQNRTYPTKTRIAELTVAETSLALL